MASVGCATSDVSFDDGTITFDSLRSTFDGTRNGLGTNSGIDYSVGDVDIAIPIDNPFSSDSNCDCGC